VPVTFGFNGHQGYDHVLVGKNIMHVDGEDTAAQRQSALKESHDFLVAFVIPRQRTVARHMPDYLGVERLQNRRDVAPCEIPVCLADNGGVTLDHRSPQPCSDGEKLHGYHSVTTDSLVMIRRRSSGAILTE
jgi:hypothetical protein